MPLVTIIYPTDPIGIIPGGTDTCIRDILRCSPDDIRIRLIGATTDPHRRPVGIWTECQVGGKNWDMYPVLSVKSLKSRLKIPLSLQFTLKLLGCDAWKGSDILQFHRIEPSLPFLTKQIPMINVIHQNMNVLRDKSSDIRWKHFPSAFYRLEKLVLTKNEEVFVVREDAANDYIARFPEMAGKIRFFPTWVNEDVFFPLTNEEDRDVARKAFFRDAGLEPGASLLLFVGRLDHQKDPHLLIDTLEIVFQKKNNVQCLLVGDGILRKDLEERVNTLGLCSQIRFAGALEQGAVARWLQIADLVVLSSAYEGMPRCAVEALGCGVPVVSTDVGEIRRLVTTGVNGAIAEERTKESLCASILGVLEKLELYRGRPCLKAVEKYTAKCVLGDLYDAYRKIGSRRSMN